MPAQPEYLVILNEEKHRFEMHVDGHEAYEVFKRFAGGIAYLHTIVPEELAGRGGAGNGEAVGGIFAGICLLPRRLGVSGERLRLS